MNTQPNESDRLATLRRTGLLDSEPCEAFDRVTRLAARTLAVPTVLVSLVDTTRQWFKSRYGCEFQESPRDISFCTHTVSRRQPLIVPDAALDVRFANNPLVTHAPHIRAYLGIPLFAQDGHAVGALCAIDTKPRDFGNEDVAALSDFARIVEDVIHAHETANEARDREVQAAVSRHTRQLQVANDALRTHVKRLVESERAARAAEQRIHSIVDGLPVMIAYWNRFLRCEFANAGYRSWFGLPPQQQAAGLSMPELMGDWYAGVEPHVSRVLQGHAQRFERLDLPRPVDGKPVSLEVRYVPDIDGSPEVRGFISLVTDTTAYRSPARE
jgi:PAS domain-containing protein